MGIAQSKMPIAAKSTQANRANQMDGQTVLGDEARISQVAVHMWGQGPH